MNVYISTAITLVSAKLLKSLLAVKMDIVASYALH